MGTTRTRFEVRRIVPDSVDHRLALHLVLGLRPPQGGRTATEVTTLLSTASRGKQSVDLVFGVYRSEGLMAAALALESPGATALVLVSDGPDSVEHHPAALQALKALQAAAWGRSLALLEVLVPPNSQRHAQLLQEAGFRLLTRLIYLRRPVSVTVPDLREVTDIEWTPFTHEAEPLFARAIEQTYAQTQDCPELSGLRPTSDVLAGHRAAGVFDPQLWHVAVRRQEPVGVLLLNRLTSEPAIEVVYMGVAQPARRQGVAHALLARAVQTARTGSARYLTLAVDQRNLPARTLYKRWGFVEFGARDAWIASPVPV